MKKMLWAVISGGVKNFAVDIFLLIFGSALYAFAFVYFIKPQKISPGGVTGVSMVVNYLVPMAPVGFLILLINIPVICLGYYKMGGRFVLKTMFVTFLSSSFIDIFTIFFPGYDGERLVAALFGGVIMGFSIAIIMLRGATTGGTDILAKVIRLKLPYFSMGRLMLFLDSIIITVSALVYKDFETAIYSVVYLTAQSLVLDRVLYGSDSGRFLFIVTDKGKEISELIFKVINRGVTFVPAIGGFKDEKKQLLLCAMRSQEVDKAVNTVKITDPNAFTVVTITGGVFGQGFEKKYDI